MVGGYGYHGVPHLRRSDAGRRHPALARWLTYYPPPALCSATRGRGTGRDFAGKGRSSAAPLQKTSLAELEAVFGDDLFCFFVDDGERGMLSGNV